MLRFVALIDTETTGLDPIRDRAIEVAVSLFDVQRARSVASFASLIRGPAENAAEHVNGIPAELLPEARDPEHVWGTVRWLLEPAQIILAHHAEFDQQFTPDLGRPWVCTENDVAWPGRARGGSLVHLALSFGLGVSGAHRAMTDVDTLSRILTRFVELGHELEPVLLHAMRPKAMVHSLAPYEMKDVVKEHGFRWNKDEKVWWRKMSLEDAEKLPFKVRVAK